MSFRPIYLILGRDDAPLRSLALLVDEPRRPVAGHAVVHRVVDVEDVVLGERKVRRVAVVVDRVAVKHGAHEIGVTGLVLDHVVF